jgi:hypothetical protein
MASDRRAKSEVFVLACDIYDESEARPEVVARSGAVPAVTAAQRRYTPAGPGPPCM